MVGSLLVALGIVTCTAAGGHCDSPSTQLRTEQQQQVQARHPSVSVTDETDEANRGAFEQRNEQRAR